MGVYAIDGTPLGVAHNIQGGSLSGVYTIGGDYIPLEISPAPIDYDSYEQSRLFSYISNNNDGCAVHNWILVQLVASNKFLLFDLERKVYLSGPTAIQSGHGDSVSFSREKYSEADEFPLLYVTTDAASNQTRVNVCRMTRSSAALVRAYVFPFERTGYYGAHAFDEDNGTMYILGYSEESFTSDNGGTNKTVVSIWDMAHLTDNGDGTFTPAFVSAYERSFIYCMQGLQYHDGLIWIASGYWSANASHVYGMRPADGVIEHTITMNDIEEIEGIAWVYDREQNKFCLITTQQNHTGEPSLVVSRFDFAEEA